MSSAAPLLQSVTSEGGLLPPDTLARIAILDRDIPGLAPIDYRLGESERLGEAISRSWSRLVVLWRSFRVDLQKLPPGDLGTTLTRERFLQPLFQELGYGRLPVAKAIEVDGREYAISHGYGHVPIHMLGANVSLEDRQKGVSGAARSSPHGLLQDLLNRSKAHGWGILTNGRLLRLLRDHHSLTTQAYVEIDLETLFDGAHYSDFVLLWLLFHQSRVEADKIEDTWLEKWFLLARTEGVQALDQLRDGVERAITALGAGFLKHPHNQALRDALADGSLDKQDLYRQLLRLVYRLIFLFAAEDRDALLDPAESATLTRARYHEFYASKHLRALAGKMRGGPHGDLWQKLLVVMRGLDEGCAPLALPALGSFLWHPSAVSHLTPCQLSNQDLLAAVYALSYLERQKQRFPVSWRTVAADELGGIYEGLLELHPVPDASAGTFALTTAAGHERKKTGSYYTPTSLVNCLLDSALDPVIADAVAGKSRDDAEAALLGLKVVDPACGSGHFLVAAARRIARRLANVRSGGEEPSPQEMRRALRDVVGRCVYGVDLQEMAVELCKIALWMEALEPAKPLSFLDAHIQHGNSLLGATPALMARGIPDEAWEVIEGDDKPIAKLIKKRNRDARKGKQLTTADALATHDLAAAASAAMSGDDSHIEDIHTRARRWSELQSSSQFREAIALADTWCAAFVWKKQAGQLAADAPTHDIFTAMRRSPGSAPASLSREVGTLSRQYGFFHWHLAFPEVFVVQPGTPADDDLTGWKGGFDCVLGNPPWERVKLQEKEFFAGRSDAIEKAENASQRKKLIAKLPETDLALWLAWTEASRSAEGESHWMRNSGRYPLCGQGDINTYSIFAELNRSLMGARGHVGCILPPGIATDDTTKEFFASLAATSELTSFYEFENEEKLFPAVDHRVHFSLLGLARGRPGAPADLAFGLRQTSALEDQHRCFSLTAEEFGLLNPNTKTCPTFRSRRDAEINKAIYRRLPVLWREDAEDGNPWGIRFMRMLDMATDSGLFRSREDCEADGFKLVGNHFVKGAARLLPLYEAKMVHHFDHRFGTYEGQTEAQSNQGKCPEFDDDDHANPNKLPLPYYWVPEADVASRLEGRWARSWLIGWRDICRTSDMRTVIASAIPGVGAGHKFPLLFPNGAPELCVALYATLSSLVFDYCARQKVGGTSMTYFILKQLPAPTPATIGQRCQWSPVSIAAWLALRTLELTATSVDMLGFARDCGHDGGPFKWDPERRPVLRAELDAAFFHLYGVSHDDTDYILDTFPVLRDKETRQFGEYRTKRLVLERYDALAAAIASGTPYVSPLSSPPGDPRAAHPALPEAHK